MTSIFMFRSYICNKHKKKKIKFKKIRIAVLESKIDFSSQVFNEIFDYSAAAQLCKTIILILSTLDLVMAIDDP